MADTVTLKKGKTVIKGVNPDKVEHYVSHGWEVVEQEKPKAPVRNTKPKDEDSK